MRRLAIDLIIITLLNLIRVFTKMLIGWKWKCLRYYVKIEQISFKKCLERMFFIQELESDKFPIEYLGELSNRKIKRLYNHEKRLRNCNK